MSRFLIGKGWWKGLLFLAVTSSPTLAEIGPTTGTRSLVVAYHPEAVSVGQQILRSGGNAFDAFVATTFIQYVLAEGVTSAAGPLVALTYHAKEKKVLQLDGWFNNVKDPLGRWDDTDPVSGKAIVVPGAIRALEELSRRYGNLAFAQVLLPAAELARKGFAVNALHAALISGYAEVLRKSEYGRRTFFRNGQSLREGDHLELPEVAAFVQKLREQGADYAYVGDWAKAMVDLAQAQGGRLTLDDLKAYRAEWREPLKVTYRGLDVYAPGGRIWGGLWTLLGLKALENWLPTASHYSSSADDLEVLIRLSRELDAESWIYRMENLDDRSLIESRLTSAYAKSIWNRVRTASSSEGASSPPGTHSYHVIVIDQDGNAVTGTNTINAHPWADGYFIEGIPLPNAGKLADKYYYGEVGGRRVTGLSMHFAFQSGKLKFATGAFSGSLVPAELQFLVNLIDYQLNASDAVTRPRFGITAGPLKKTNLSKRISPEIVRELEKRGLFFEQSGSYVETGLGCAAVVNENGTLEGAFAPLREASQ